MDFSVVGIPDPNRSINVRKRGPAIENLEIEVHIRIVAKIEIYE